MALDFTAQISRRPLTALPAAGTLTPMPVGGARGRGVAVFLLALLALAFGLLALGSLSNLWADYRDSEPSVYIWTGAPAAALSVACAARLISLVSARRERLAVGACVACLILAVIAAAIGIAVVDESLWIEIAAAVVLALLFFGRTRVARAARDA